MSKLGLLLVLTVVAEMGCATRRDTGAALVTAGAVAVGMGAQAATGTHCSSMGNCYVTRPSSVGAGVAVAGAAAAVAGYALLAKGDGDRSAPSRVRSDASAKDWHLHREPDTEQANDAGLPCAPAAATSATAPADSGAATNYASGNSISVASPSSSGPTQPCPSPASPAQ